MDEATYMWTDKRGQLVRYVRGEKGLNALLRMREYSIELKMKHRGMTYEEAEREWGTITRVD